MPTKDLRQDKYAYHAETEIAQAVHDAFVHDRRVLSFEPIVTIQGGTVTLAGTVSSLAAKRAAEQNAHNVLGGEPGKQSAESAPRYFLLNFTYNIRRFGSAGSPDLDGGDDSPRPRGGGRGRRSGGF